MNNVELRKKGLEIMLGRVDTFIRVSFGKGGEDRMACRRNAVEHAQWCCENAKGAHKEFVIDSLTELAALCKKFKTSEQAKHRTAGLKGWLNRKGSMNQKFGEIMRILRRNLQLPEQEVAKA